MFRVFGNPASGGTRKVLAVLHETSTPFDFELIDFAKREHKQPAFLARQPFGQVPAIDDDGFVLFEARAICRYVSAKAGDPLVPKPLRERALMDQWCSVEQANLAPNVMKFVYHHVFRRQQEQAALDAASAMLEQTLAVLSKPLATQPYLVGDAFSLADLFCLPYLEYLNATPMGPLVAQFPAVAAWWARLRERPSWRRVMDRG